MNHLSPVDIDCTVDDITTVGLGVSVAGDMVDFSSCAI